MNSHGDIVGTFVLVLGVLVIGGALLYHHIFITVDPLAMVVAVGVSVACLATFTAVGHREAVTKREAGS